MGHSLDDRILKPLLIKRLKDKSLRKPLLVRSAVLKIKMSASQSTRNAL